MAGEHFNKLQIVMFMSYQFTSSQTQYHMTEQEALAALKVLEEFRWLVKGSVHPVKLYTDHQALLKTLKSEDSTGRIAQWQLRLSEYDLNIHHVLGRELAVVNGLSRLIRHPLYSPPTGSEDVELMAFTAEDEAIAGSHPQDEVPQALERRLLTEKEEDDWQE